ncbi:MAG: NAD(P)/FAD-dependent oxidoreductase [Anaerolineae bacterium]|nr:NAD(P)/FAD-dependent oxidoreductase [Thermoflexales bacterium]MDW8408139.1 NAD(P)/FAD-dependent oxidoreductase [Anaerolineae bacterium]
MARILVIGAGVGGATAAALLAKAGHAVTVLEAHVYPGGSAGTFYHKGYRFDAGATLAGGFHPGGPHDVVGRALGIHWPIHPAEPAWQVHLPDRTLTRWGDSQRWQEELARVFADQPNVRRALRFFREVEDISDAVWDFASRKPAWPPAGLRDLLTTGLALRPATLAALPHAFETVGGWAERCGVTGPAWRTFLDAQLLISAQTTAAYANALFGAAAIDLPRKGVNHVAGGIGSIAEQLVDAVRRFGGDVLFRQQVTRLEVQDGRVVAAHTNKGLRVACDVCIANLTPWNLAQVLGDNTPARLARELRARPAQWGAFVVHAGVEAGDDLTPVDHHQVIGDYDQPLGEGNSVFLSFNMPGDRTRAPAGHRTLTISTHTRAAAWWALRHKPGGQAEYEARVAEYTERLLALAERAVPGLRSRLRLVLPGTPVTYQFYTRRHLGGVGGFPMTSLFTARGPWTGLRNAWLVGDSIFPGQSTAGVTMGALRVVDEVLHRLATRNRRFISIVPHQAAERRPEASEAG